MSMTNIPEFPRYRPSSDAGSSTANRAAPLNQSLYKSFTISFGKLKSRVCGWLSAKPKPMTLTSLPKLYARKSLDAATDIRAGWLASSPHKFGDAPERYTEAYKEAFTKEFGFNYPLVTVETAIKFAHIAAEDAMHALTASTNTDQKMADYASFIVARNRHAQLTAEAIRQGIAPPLPMSPEPPSSELGRGADGEMVGPDFALSAAPLPATMQTSKPMPLPKPLRPLKEKPDNQTIRNARPKPAPVTDAKERVFMAFQHARNICTVDSKRFDKISQDYNDYFKMAFDAHFKKFYSPGTSEIRAAGMAIKKASGIATNLMKFGGNAMEREYANELSHMTKIINETTMRFFRTTRNLTIEEARNALRIVHAASVDASTAKKSAA